MRGLAILLVILFHHTLMEKRTAFDRVYVELGRLGWCGVDLFFVLSGFLITGILYDSKGGRHYFRNFYARRTLRIFPLYYFVVFFSLYVLPVLPSWVPRSDLVGLGEAAMSNRSSAWYWFYLSNFLVAKDGMFRHPILGLSWSLAIEEQFYLVWPLVVFSFGRAALMRISIALIVLGLLLRTAMVMLAVAPTIIYVLPFSRMDALATGGLLALVLRRDGSFDRLTPWARVILPVGAAAIVAIAGLTDEADWTGPVMQSAGYTILALMFGALLVLVVGSAPTQRMARVFSHRWLRFFGKYSYALYLFHVSVRRVIRDHYYGVAEFPTLLGSQLPGQLLFYVVATAPAVLLAWVSWHALEKRVLALKRFVPYDRDDDRRSA